MNDLMANWPKVLTKVQVHVPTLDGTGIAETINVEVEGYQNPTDREIYFSGETLEKLDEVKSRHMGLLLPEEIKELRDQMGVTQKRMGELLQIGEKSYCRWENGRERPSRSLNLLLAALSDGRIDVAYLESRMKPNFDWRKQIERSVKPEDRIVRIEFRESCAIPINSRWVGTGRSSTG
jgi:DNA-binding transcriptional regulator YiaG